MNAHTQARLLFSCLLAGILLSPRASADAPATAASPLRTTVPDFFIHDTASVASTCARIAASDPTIKPALNILIRDADALLALKPASVMDKPLTAVSGDKHDYLSLAPYWWPDPSKPDGLPYIRRDGKVNPESKTGTDSNAFQNTCNAVATLGFAYCYTGNETYAQKAAHMTRVWFLDEATRMNPNLIYAQGINGITHSRGIGLIEARGLGPLLNGLSLISSSPAWPAESQAAMRAWLEKYYTWLVTSKNGRAESVEKNNHGTWYDVQAAQIELALGKTDVARARIEKKLPVHIAGQIKADGCQSHEFGRADSLFYSLFNLKALFTLSVLGERIGCKQPWGGSIKNEHALRNALVFVARHLDPINPWPKKDSRGTDIHDVLPLLRIWLAHHNDSELKSLYEKYAAAPDEQSKRWMLTLLPPR